MDRRLRRRSCRIAVVTVFLVIFIVVWRSNTAGGDSQLTLLSSHETKPVRTLKETQRDSLEETTFSGVKAHIEADVLDTNLPASKPGQDRVFGIEDSSTTRESSEPTTVLASKTVNHDAASPTSMQRPETSSDSVPINITTLSKTVVMGATAKEDTSWVGAKLPSWDHATYRVDLAENETSPTGFRTKINKGREAMPYLTYIVDNYDSLPDVMAFIHPHRNGYPAAWHNDADDYDAALMLKQLRLDTVVKRGYVNLRCLWEPGCPDQVQPWREPPDLEMPHEHAFPHFYSNFFNMTLDETRKAIPVVATPCCAQFAVSRQQVRERSKADYQKYQRILEITKYDDDTSGRVMEYMWHIIFGQEAVFCPELYRCWCDVFGRSC